MDVKTVCLGMLTDGAASGYDLKKQFESTFGHFFSAGYGSIYPALSSLAEDGLVDCEEIPQEGKPDRKLYRITDAGREHLLAALDKPDPSHKVRSEFLATMWFAHLMTGEQIRTVLTHRLDEIRQYLDMFETFDREEAARSQPGMRFVCGCGKAVMKAMQAHIEKHGHELGEDTDIRLTAAN